MANRESSLVFLMAWRSTLVGFLLLATATAAQTATEYQVKAAFVFNFAKFVEWPARSFKSPSDTIYVCVLGDSVFETALTDVIAGKKINERPLAGVRLSDIKEAGRCHILFIGNSEHRNLRGILAATASSAILTVGESDHFALDGGMIGFRLEDGKVRLEINLPAAEQAQVQISSKLLSLAQIVKR
jgi:hypothetical protein